MHEKIMLGDFIRELRKEKGLSQEELGLFVGVSNKAVSKWETGEANPELKLIPKLAKALGVTADELLSCERREDAQETRSNDEDGRAYRQFFFLGADMLEVAPREYVSVKKNKKGKPFLHINFNNFRSRAEGTVAIAPNAKGLLAIGLISKGIFSIGLLSVGILSFGILSVGLLALGTLCLGLIAAGGVSLGLVAAFGGLAAGFFAFGGIAVGFYAFGGIAVGYYAFTGVGGIAVGVHTFFIE